MSHALSNLGSGLDPTSGDHLKITMQTRVAVRDQTPHRFQIVPLREVDKHVVTSPMPALPSKKLSQTMALNTSSSFQTHTKNGRHLNVEKHDDAPSNEIHYTKLDITPRFSEPRTVLARLDLNRNTRLSTKPSSETTIKSGKLENTHRLPSHDFTSSSLHNFHGPHGSNGHFRQGDKHQTLTALGSTHASEISQLFHSQTSATSSPFRRRNRSLTVTTIRSDTSVDMVDTQEVESKLKRRHAIYRESSCLPYLGKSQVKNSCLEQTYDSAASTVQALTKEAASAQGDNNFQDPFQYELSKPQDPNYLSPKWASGNFSLVRPLNLSKTEQRRPLTTNIYGEMIYPQTVLDLFRDIDQAIHDWAQP